MSLRNIVQQIRQNEAEADRVYEAVIGIVTDNQDPEKLARVKVKFPTLPNAGDPDVSYWARLAALGAGEDRGWCFIPEVDDEVVVVFEQGDVRRPIVLGALWSDVDKPPETNSGSNPRRLIVSKLGHKFIFDDDGGKIEIHDSTGSCHFVIDSGANKISLKSDTNDVLVNCPVGTLTMAAQTIDISANMKANVESIGDLALGAGSTMELGGMAMCEVNADKIQLNPGGVPKPESPSGKDEPVADPLTSRAEPKSS